MISTPFTPSARASWRSPLLNLLRQSHASTLLETALVLPFLVLVLAGAFDFGEAYYAAIEVANAAEAGAQYGLQNVTNLSGMQNAATLDAANIVGTHAVATYGCECSDGTAAVASCTSSPATCTYNIVNYVQVVVTAAYKPTLSYPGAPASIPLSSTVRLRAGQ